MGYAAARGGQEAIRAAQALEGETLSRSGLTVEAVEEGLGYAVDQVMSEAGLYAPKLAARAVTQARGDLAEAAFLLRAYRSTLPRAGYTPPADTDAMRLVRRVSSTYKDVPGGQILGPTRDYSQRLLGARHEDEPHSADHEAEGEGELPRVTDLMRRTGLLPEREPEDGREPADLTREPLTVPASRAVRLQSLSRGEPGAMGALAYSSQRGFGPDHPTLAEFRVGYLPLTVTHPHTGAEVEIGEVRCTEVETVGRGAEPEDAGRNGHSRGGVLSSGYGLVFGRNERKAISMAVLDATVRSGKDRPQGPQAPAEDEEFVLYHTDGVEASGFVEHLKLPHYVTFRSSLDGLGGGVED